MSNENSVNIVALSEVPFVPIEWLARPFLELRTVGIMQGPPGCGKTAMSCCIAAKVSTGGNIMDIKFAQGNVLIFTTEDDASVIRGRIEADGGNLKKCFFVEDAHKVNFSTAELKDIIEAENPKLVLFDPLQSFIGSDIQMNQANQTRERLNGLKELAKKCDCTILIVCHIGKSIEGKNPVNRSIGSTDIPAIARTVIEVGEDPTNPNQRIMAHVKSSHSEKSRSISFTIGERGGVTITGYSNVSAYDLGNSRKRIDNNTSYEEEKLVTVIRQLMNENKSIGRISYKTLSSIAGVYYDGKTWKAEIKRLSREIYIRDRFIVSAEGRAIETDFDWNGKTIKSPGESVRGLSVRKALDIDLDKLLGGD
jgi:hypothetical protein